MCSQVPKQRQAACAMGTATRPFGFDCGQPSLFIGGLPAKFTGAAVKDIVECISGRGTVSAVHMKSGFCFVDFVFEESSPPDPLSPNTRMADKVAAELDGYEVCGHRLGVRVQTYENHQQSKREIKTRKRQRNKLRRAQTEGQTESHATEDEPPVLEEGPPDWSSDAQPLGTHQQFDRRFPAAAAVQPAAIVQHPYLGCAGAGAEKAITTATRAPSAVPPVMMVMTPMPVMIMQVATDCRGMPMQQVVVPHPVPVSVPAAACSSPLSVALAMGTSCSSL
eukprot:TRINITY_DN60424_c0_g1_i1.p2 TRINITY_DN60424_c0_g1~~TRINITY_DN60424_c0_g1_i1.p2  ORF type:complete len:279 (+),score=53.81 TRINITY_DN60424_c0_g1_i1:103-939(+)